MITDSAMFDWGQLETANRVPLENEGSGMQDVEVAWVHHYFVLASDQQLKSHLPTPTVTMR